MPATEEPTTESGSATEAPSDTGAPSDAGTPSGSDTSSDTDTPSEEDVPATESDDATDGPAVLSLTDTGTSQDGFEISLSDFSRAVTGPDDIPQSTPYVKFTINVKNGTDSAVDLASELTLSCSSGSSPGEEVYGTGTNEGSGFTTSVLPGRSAHAVYGCTLPSDEKYLQVEIAPSFDMETVVFSGNVQE